MLHTLFCGRVCRFGNKNQWDYVPCVDGTLHGSIRQDKNCLWCYIGGIKFLENLHFCGLNHHFYFGRSISWSASIETLVYGNDGRWKHAKTYLSLLMHDYGQIFIHNYFYAQASNRRLWFEMEIGRCFNLWRTQRSSRNRFYFNIGIESILKSKIQNGKSFKYIWMRLSHTYDQCSYL